ncbi:MAG: hypothetical protein IT473_11475 [Lysobacter sp.]|nr:hypothetical protein [Lysobacter sp.]
MLIALVFSTAAAQVQTQAQMDAAARALYAEAERVYETDLRKSAMLSERALAALDPAAERALRREIEAHLGTARNAKDGTGWRWGRRYRSAPHGRREVGRLPGRLTGGVVT